MSVTQKQRRVRMLKFQVVIFLHTATTSMRWIQEVICAQPPMRKSTSGSKNTKTMAGRSSPQTPTRSGTTCDGIAKRKDCPHIGIVTSPTAKVPSRINPTFDATG